MTCLCWSVMLFSALTLHFVYEEYRQNRFPKKAFILVSVLEAAAMIATAGILILSI